MSSRTYEDAARFRPDDLSEVVAASFTCPYCLELPSSVLVEPDFVAATASCRCSACDAAYLIRLDEGQTMRLVVAPPPQLLHVEHGVRHDSVDP